MIFLKSAEEIDKMRAASQVVVSVLERLKEEVKAGVSTWDLDRIAEEVSRREGATPAFKGYRGYPASVCFAVNDEVVHGIPSRNKILNDGDIISLDFGAYLDGFYGDSAITVPVGKVSAKESRWRVLAIGSLTYLVPFRVVLTMRGFQLSGRSLGMGLEGNYTKTRRSLILFLRMETGEGGLN
jgi:methionine aminopeptidase type I